MSEKVKAGAKDKKPLSQTTKIKGKPGICGLCRICDYGIYGKQDPLPCKLCEKVFHRECCDIAKADFPFVYDKDTHISKFSCEFCLRKRNDSSIIKMTSPENLDKNSDNSILNLSSDSIQSNTCQSDLGTSASINLLLTLVKGLCSEVDALKQQNVQLIEEIHEIKEQNIEIKSLARSSGIHFPPLITPELDSRSTRNSNDGIKEVNRNSFATLAKAFNNQPLPIRNLNHPSGSRFFQHSATNQIHSNKKAPENGHEKRKKILLVGGKTKETIKAIAKLPKLPPKKALFISRLPNSVTNEELKEYIETDSNLNTVICTRINTKFPRYSSFHVTCSDDEFVRLSDPGNFPKDCLVTEFFGQLKDNQKYTNNAQKNILNSSSKGLTSDKE